MDLVKKEAQGSAQQISDNRGENGRLRIFSWNVNGIRAVEKKGALAEFIEKEKPDVLLVQETKIGGEKGAEKIEIPLYKGFYAMGERAGYSGTAIFVREEIVAREGLTGENGELRGEELKILEDSGAFLEKKGDRYGNPDSEGRVAVVEFPEFFVVSVYTPNAKDDLSRLELREKIWDPAFLIAMKKLANKKPVIFAGDFNAAHEEIDIARPEANHFHAGFTDQERKGISNILEAGFVDSFRKLHPTEVKYSWWSYRMRARERNVGWRIDYFFLSPELVPKMRAAEIFDQYMGSDHCPIGVEIDA